MIDCQLLPPPKRDSPMRRWLRESAAVEWQRRAAALLSPPYRTEVAFWRDPQPWLQEWMADLSSIEIIK